MPRFFVRSEQVHDGTVTLVGPDAHHLHRSLRVRPGEHIVVVEDGATEHVVAVESTSDTRVTGRVVSSRAARGEPRLSVHVLLALAAQRMDAAVVSLAVTGAASIVPVRTERGVPRPGAGSAGHRVERWRSLALNAAQLAGRARPPVVHDVQRFGDAIAALGECRILACVIGGNSVPLATLPGQSGSAALVIGPEGGLAPQEIAALRSRDACFVHLGPRTLPHHLAGAVAVSLLLAASGDLSASVDG